MIFWDVFLQFQLHKMMQKVLGALSAGWKWAKTNRTWKLSCWKHIFCKNFNRKHLETTSSGCNCRLGKCKTLGGKVWIIFGETWFRGTRLTQNFELRRLIFRFTDKYLVLGAYLRFFGDGKKTFNIEIESISRNDDLADGGNLSRFVRDRYCSHSKRNASCRYGWPYHSQQIGFFAFYGNLELFTT